MLAASSLLGKVPSGLIGVGGDLGQGQEQDPAALQQPFFAQQRHDHALLRTRGLSDNHILPYYAAKKRERRRMGNIFQIEAADRAIREYARDIWGASPVKGEITR